MTQHQNTQKCETLSVIQEYLDDGYIRVRSNKISSCIQKLEGEIIYDWVTYRQSSFGNRNIKGYWSKPKWIGRARDLILDVNAKKQTEKIWENEELIAVIDDEDSKGYKIFKKEGLDEETNKSVFYMNKNKTVLFSYHADRVAKRYPIEYVSEDIQSECNAMVTAWYI